MNVSQSRKGCIRACERCRKSKVRCLTDAVDREGKCKRCYKAGAECVFPVLTGTQQRRRRTDARIALIEEKLAVVNATIGKEQVSQMLTPSSTISASDPTRDVIETCIPVSRGTAQSLTEPNGPRSTSVQMLLDSQPQSSSAASFISDNGDTIPDYVEHALLSTDQAKALFSNFRSETINEYPIVTLSDSDSFETLRSEKPMLLFAIVTSASQGQCPTLFRKLHRKLQQSLVEKAILKGQKSLELIQAILLMEAWYCPPDDLNHLNFCQWANIAGAMALQIGLIGMGRHATHKAEKVRNFGEATDNELSYWRTVIAVSLAVSTIAISLHRQAIFGLKYASQHCFDLLSTRSILPVDQRLTAWARLQLVAEEIEALRIGVFTETNHQILGLQLEKLESRLDEWRQLLAADVMNVSLNVHFLYCRCKLFELAMLAELRNIQRSVIDAKRHDETVSMQSGDIIVTPSLVKAVMSVIQCCHGIIDLVCQMAIQQYLDCPTVTTVRALYAINTLSALEKSFVEHRNILFRFIDSSSIMLHRYSYRLRTFLHKAEGPQEHAVPKMVSSTLDQVAREPYLLHDCGLHDQIFQIDQVNGVSSTGEARLSPCNDLEAVVVSNMPDSAQTEQASVLMRNSPDKVLQHDHDYEAGATQATDPATAFRLPVTGSTDLDMTNLSEFDLMCMPDLVAGTNSWLTSEDDEMNFLMPETEPRLSMPTHSSSTWL